MAIGKLVRLTGLMMKPAWNGCIVRVQRWVPEKRRYRCVFPGSSAAIGVKSENIAVDFALLGMDEADLPSDSGGGGAGAREESVCAVCCAPLRFEVGTPVEANCGPEFGFLPGVVVSCSPRSDAEVYVISVAEFVRGSHKMGREFKVTAPRDDDSVVRLSESYKNRDRCDATPTWARGHYGNHVFWHGENLPQFYLHERYPSPLRQKYAKRGPPYQIRDVHGYGDELDHCDRWAVDRMETRRARGEYTFW